MPTIVHLKDEVSRDILNKFKTPPDFFLTRDVLSPALPFGLQPGLLYFTPLGFTIRLQMQFLPQKPKRNFEHGAG